MQQGRLSLALLALLAVTRCVTTNATPLGPPTKRPALTPEQVVLYRTAAQVPGRYEEIALLHSSGDASFSDEAMMYQSMRKKAASLGANGVILDAMTEPSAGAKVAAAIFWVPTERKGKALAIYVLPGEPGSGFESAKLNLERFGQVHVGQVFDHVITIMGGEPDERRLENQPDGKKRELWLYRTGAKDHRSTIIFIDGRVAELIP